MVKEDKLLTVEDLLMGASASYKIPIPPDVLNPTLSQSDEKQPEMIIHLKPLTVGIFQLIMKASREDPGLIPLLMIKESLVEPKMTLDQVKRMHLGLVEFLVDHVREISGLTKKKRS